jgi:ABC-type nitrate/sulfonate/bicarbonate transport system substrate-binding protein
VSGIGSGRFSAGGAEKKQPRGGRDVLILSLGVMPTIYSGLQAGIVDAAMLSPPFTFRAEENGFREIIAFTKQELVELQGSILVKEAFLQSDPVTLEKFIRATSKGFLYIKQNRSGTIPILARYLQVNGDLAAKAYDQVVRPALTPDGTLSEELQKKAVEHVLKRLDVKEPPALSRVFDFSITRKVVTELQTKGWKPGS